MSIVIAGERSGVGKTTVTIALLASLRHRAMAVQSFKVGPDYIDPMFHQYITDRPCYNLDPILTCEQYVRDSFHRHSQSADCAIVEGVMGLFDGVELNSEFGVRNSGVADFASTAHISRLLKLPVVLVLDCSRLSGSIAAIACGYRDLDRDVKLAGVVLNRVGSDRHLELLQNAIEPHSIPILGVFRRHDEIQIRDRHLGLVPTDELPELDGILDRLVELGKTSFSWEKFLPMLSVQASKLPIADRQLPITHYPLPKIAIARDRAFNFYYQDNLDWLERCGAELVFWSPLSDANLPPDTCGLYFGGGFPEVFASELADNFPMLDAVRNAIVSEMPTYAECGGLMYLSQTIVDLENKARSMVGILPTVATMGAKLTLGYRRAVALRQSPMLPQGSTVWGHEFHRSHLDSTSDRPLFQLEKLGKLSAPFTEGWTVHRVHASYLHLHWGASPQLPQQFVSECDRFRHQNG